MRGGRTALLPLPCLLLACLLAAGPAPRARGQDATDPADPIVVEGGTTEVHAAPATPERRALPGSPYQPGSRHVLTRADFRDTQQSVADALEAVPGVVVERSGDALAPTRVRLRGGRADQVLVVVDGVPQRSASDQPGTAREQNRVGTDLAAIPLERVERIEVVRGAATAEAGPGAAAGVIRITTRQPRERSATVQHTEGTGGYRESHAAWAEPLPALGPDAAAEVSVTRRFTEGAYVYYDPADEDRTTTTDPAAEACSKDLGGGYKERRCNEAESWRLGLELAPDARARWGLTLETLERRGLGGVEDPRPEGRERQDTTTLRWSDGWFLGPEDGTEVGASAYGARTDATRTENAEAASSAVFTGGFRDDRAGGEVWAERWWGIHQGRLGVDGAHQSLADRNFSATRDRNALFGKWTAHLAGGAVTGALRRDTYSDLGPAGTYSMAASHFVAGPLGLKASHGTGFRPPSLYELYDPGSGQGESVANPALEAERSRSADAGVFVDAPEHYHAEVLYFQQDYENDILAVAQAEQTSVFRFENVRRTRSTGVEAQGTWLLPRGYSLAATVTRTDAVILDNGAESARDEGNQVPGIPELAWQAELAWQREAWRAGLRTRYRSRRYVDTANSRYLKPYQVADASLGFPLWGAFSGALAVNNLTNTTYAELDNHPPPGRQVLLTVRWHWPSGAEDAASEADGQAEPLP